ncbi:hypothetical protein BD310DRAFT_910930, partial [Dichomitus squalens]
SSDLWVPSTSCDSCGSHNKYDLSTSGKESSSFSISYGDGSTASGNPYTDTVLILTPQPAVGGDKVIGQDLAAGTQESPSRTTRTVSLASHRRVAKDGKGGPLWLQAHLLRLRTLHRWHELGPLQGRRCRKKGVAFGRSANA